MLKNYFLAFVFLFAAAGTSFAQLTATISNQKEACQGLFNGSFDVTQDFGENINNALSN